MDDMTYGSRFSWRPSWMSAHETCDRLLFELRRVILGIITARTSSDARTYIKRLSNVPRTGQ